MHFILFYFIFHSILFIRFSFFVHRCESASKTLIPVLNHANVALFLFFSCVSFSFGAISPPIDPFSRAFRELTMKLNFKAAYEQIRLKNELIWNKIQNL